MKGIMGKKLGMTQIFGETGELVAVTVIEATPNVVVQKKTVDKEGYDAVQLGFEPIREKLANKPKKGHFEKAGAKPMRFLREFKDDSFQALDLGSEVKVDIFEEGSFVDITGISKGKGTQGVIKRHGFQRGRESHGSKFHRMPGGLSAGTYPGRVFKGKRMEGRMGNEKVTVQNLEIVRVDADKNLLLVKGAVPGARNGMVLVKAALKK
ncbi:large subunit ribosomal protein L3 [Ezakiella coagulans]|uniref:Large ribosomal subunit protein uL3 n=1 Tax=Ezakiella coagulans TaxID=46507 RepID=A0A2U1E707_9FIRM|nr:50S ribosomal protein L3 [Ezakiella coagulans]KGF06807.1 50S ribosomal protein L3 [Tissierellia bacterium S7-1-4]PVY95642.1 large subunit ribosomal protein L3 [Ezakiella coagulans]UQK61354.1 50S ribosomal protein L3 [Ezakiella coagulans]